MTTARQFGGGNVMSTVSDDLGGLCCKYLQNSMAAEDIQGFMGHLNEFYTGVPHGRAFHVYRKDALHYLNFALRLETLLHELFKSEFGAHIRELHVCDPSDFRCDSDGKDLSFELQTQFDAIMRKRPSIFNLPAICTCTSVINFVCIVLVVCCCISLSFLSFVICL